MSFHVGILFLNWTGYINVNNSETGETFEYKIETDGNIEKERIDSMFAEIKSKTNGKLGCVCICLIWTGENNENRKRLIQSGINCGFEKIEIIDEFTSIYLNAISQTDYNLKNDDVIWVSRGLMYVWKIVDNKAKYVSQMFCHSNSTRDDLIDLSGLKFPPNLVILEEEKDHEKKLHLTKKFPQSKFLYYQLKDFEYGALVKAKTMANYSNFKKFDTHSLLLYPFTVNIASLDLFSLPLGFSLPYIESFPLIIHKKGAIFYVTSCFNNRIEYKIMMEMEKGKYQFTFAIDKNGIFIAKFERNSQFYPLFLYRVIQNKMNYKKVVRRYPKLKKKFPKPRDNPLHSSLISPFSTHSFPDNIVAIDLGTSRCCAAVNRGNKFETVALESTGDRLLPSWVAFDELNPKCGQIVINRLYHKSKSTVFDGKRIIGRNFEEIEINKSWPFEIVNTEEGVKLKVQSYKCQILTYPEDISCTLLKYIKEKVDEYQGGKSGEVVITIPTEFNEAQKQATTIAAKLSGWTKKVHLLPEPIAAVYAYSANHGLQNKCKIFVFDLGGGTLDMNIIKVVDKEFKILSQSGDPNLGGRDFDNLLITHFSQILTNHYNVKINEAKQCKLMLESQKIKETLSVQESVVLALDDYDPECEEFITISRHEFVTLAQTLCEEIKSKIVKALTKAKLSSLKIDKVLLVGGGCRMPMIRKLLQECFPNSEQCCDQNPDEAVALGAAYYGYNNYFNEMKEFSRNQSRTPYFPSIPILRNIRRRGSYSSSSDSDSTRTGLKRIKRNNCRRSYFSSIPFLRSIRIRRTRFSKCSSHGSSGSVYTESSVSSNSSKSNLEITEEFRVNNLLERDDGLLALTDYANL